MNTKGVRRWVDRYERAWREQNSAAVARLFTEQAQYLDSPYEVPRIGHDAIAAEWNDPRPFTMAVESITADGSHAVVRVNVFYSEPEQEYADLWELDFAEDGRVERFVEWAYWPGKPFTASSPD
ncbi:conserved hypothetical protein [Microbacterium sp. C448]|uniref:nuclear transport factor 2 family protein n=1 Tax=Microbacterium TaxID=33882 RepID=UPI0003DE1DCD|nr:MULTISPECIES: nuclear transport factor 2 family protein [Microbacterium]CDK00511.1 conserved hypothetical protein [Microbacterium sp. C448]